MHPAQVHKVVSSFPELGRFQIVVDHPAGQRYDRAVLRAGVVNPPADADALKRALAEKLKANVLIQMDIEVVPEAEIPEAAGGPRFAETMVDRRHRS